MYRIAQFFAVSRGQLESDWNNALPGRPVPGEIRLPRRATAGSAGYDFFSPADFELSPGETILLPTGVRAKMDDGWVLMLFPRSGLGFKYRLQLNNTVGVIDSDYFGAKNEGHIMLKLTNDSNEHRTLRVNAGDAVAQGVFLPYGITVDDDADGAREGGFGSTDRQ
ncbi:MAG: deoxyuridine 5'-triphosphate nucleotidohydrolase [Clostridia bacterium]|nr:deoxyuridine 5'-triphosphate nucleotidohydrolase [Clostridia bacterium]